MIHSFEYHCIYPSETKNFCFKPLFLEEEIFRWKLLFSQNECFGKLLLFLSFFCGTQKGSEWCLEYPKSWLNNENILLLAAGADFTDEGFQEYYYDDSLLDRLIRSTKTLLSFLHSPALIQSGAAWSFFAAFWFKLHCDLSSAFTAWHPLIILILQQEDE